MNDYADTHLLVPNSFHCPPIRVSHPPALDNTARFARNANDTREVVEEAKPVLCFDCQKAIEAGKGVQVARMMCASGSGNTPHLHAIVHPGCQIERDSHNAQCPAHYWGHRPCSGNCRTPIEAPE